MAFPYHLSFSNSSGRPFKSTPFLPLLKRGITLLSKKNHLKDKMKGGLVELHICDDATIQKINHQYRGYDKPTDVVSLSYFEAEQQKDMLKVSPDLWPVKSARLPLPLVGEIIISVETAERQAKEHKKTLEEELQFLFVHGLLHIFGYDHEELKERKIMFDLQDEVLGDQSWRKIID